MPSIDKAYSWAIQTCNAPNVGYSQRYRNQQTVNGITYYDCSSFINYALLAGGFLTPSYAPKNNAFTTYTMPAELIRLGFKEVDAKGEYLAGDIGLSTSHTEMCYKGGTGGGYFMGAHTDTTSLNNQVSIDEDYFTNFPRLFRYGSGASEYGSSIYVVSALCGNAWRESTINPAINEKGTGIGFGIFQWSYGRRTALENWLKENGYDVTSPEGQIEYLIYENDWIGTFDGISSLTEFLNSSSKNIPKLTEAFMTCWERPGITALNERIEYAIKCCNFIQENAQNPSINMWYKSNDYLTEKQSLNNAVMMYRYLTAGGGGGGVETHKQKKMPVWMMVGYNYF